MNNSSLLEHSYKSILHGENKWPRTRLYPEGRPCGRIPHSSIECQTLFPVVVWNLHHSWSMLPLILCKWEHSSGSIPTPDLMEHGKQTPAPLYSYRQAIRKKVKYGKSHCPYLKNPVNNKHTGLAENRRKSKSASSLLLCGHVNWTLKITLGN